MLSGFRTVFCDPLFYNVYLIHTSGSGAARAKKIFYLNIEFFSFRINFDGSIKKIITNLSKLTKKMFITDSSVQFTVISLGILFV